MTKVSSWSWFVLCLSCPAQTFAWLGNRSPNLLLSPRASTVVLHRHGLLPRHASLHDEYDSQSESMSSVSRRDWFIRIAAQSAASAALLVHASPSTAATVAAPPVLTSRSTCDSTVSVWKLQDRVVYLLGTAHISQTSAQLAGALVRDVRPNAVFVELDLKRAGGKQVAEQVMAAGAQERNFNRIELTVDAPVTMSGTSTGGRDEGEGPTVIPTKLVIPNVVEQQQALLRQQYSSSSVTTSILPLPEIRSTEDSSALQLTKDGRQEGRSGGVGGGLGAWLFRAASDAVGKSIRGMYKNLDSAGFKPGEEFVTAIREGQAIGSDIILGDQDVELTLQRLTYALTQIDVSKLQQADEDIGKKVQELFGDQPYPSQASNDPNDLAAFVEAIKTRESVRILLSSLREVAPELVQVMLTERDAYMAAGIDSLTDEKVMVAVMGMAHIDGVEDNLKRQGWSQVRLNCERYN